MEEATTMHDLSRPVHVSLDQAGVRAEELERLISIRLLPFEQRLCAVEAKLTQRDCQQAGLSGRTFVQPRSQGTHVAAPRRIPTCCCY